jgi:4-amino-4-deoxy-L-arabinose transferase-like glycosyltransferase
VIKFFHHIVVLFVLESVLIVFSTELLSIFSFFNFYGLLGFWVITAVIIGVLIKKQWLDIEFDVSIVKRIRSLKSWDLLVFCSIAFILFITFFTAIYYPPNNWDSMTYHMARIPHWIQNQRIDHYITSIDRQNHSPPMAEYMIAQLQVLTNSDYLANLVQWYCFTLSVITAYLIAGLLKLNLRYRLFSASLMATIPMAILQSSNTQNDVVSAVFVLLFTYFLLRLNDKSENKYWILAGASFGLGLLTKGSSYIYCSAIFAAFLIIQLKQGKFYVLKKAGLVVFVGLMINAGFYFRNYQSYGNVLTDKSDNVKNETLTFSIFGSNVIRNATNHLATPNESLNNKIQSAIEHLLGEESNNPASTFQYRTYDVVYSIHEDLKGNPMHYLLILICIGMFIFSKQKTDTTWFLFLSLAFCGLLYYSLLKWQPWASRIQTSLFFLAMPFIASVISKTRLSNNMLKLLMVIILISSIPSLFFNEIRPFVHLNKESLKKNRTENYFNNKPFLYQEYSSVVEKIKELSPQKIGLIMGNNDWEYPLWVMMGNESNGASPLMVHIIYQSFEDFELLISTSEKSNEELIKAGFQEIHKEENISLFQAL